MNKTDLALPADVLAAWDFAPIFDGVSGDDGPPDPAAWCYETMGSELNRVGNRGMDRSGRPVPPDRSVEGKRWELWYDEFHDRTAFVEDGRLVFAHVIEDRDDGTRRDYTKPDGTPQPYGSYRFHGAWLHTWQLSYDHDRGDWITDPASPGVTFEPPLYVRLRLDLSKMTVPGLRFSVWLMPANEYRSNAYNDNPADGVEMDILEYDAAKPTLLECKAIAGNANQTPASSVDLAKLGADVAALEVGYLWLPDRLLWLVNGTPVVEDLERASSVPHYLILSTEGNSGVQRAGDGRTDAATEIFPHRPRSPGLYWASMIDAIERIPEHRAVVEALEVYRLSPAGSVDIPLPPTAPPPATDDFGKLRASHEALVDRVETLGGEMGGVRMKLDELRVLLQDLVENQQRPQNGRKKR